MKKKIFKQKIMMSMNKNILNMPTPSSITYMWNMGSMLGIMMMMQIMSGVILSMNFSANPNMAFQNYMMMSKNIWMGFSTKYMHSTTVSILFAMITIHIYRNISNMSMKNFKTWNSGAMIMMLMMMSAFLGYVLPWGQMSLWGATVICSMLSSIPIIGEKMVFWLWGNYTVSKPTLNRFMTFHFLIPMMIVLMMMIHMMMLHSLGSSVNSSMNPNMDKTSFKKKFYFKDMNSMIIVLTFMILIMMSNPTTLIDSENFNPANPLMTPIHIMPEWYFLFAYSMLRSIPNKLGGVMIMVMSIAIMFIMPTSNMKNKMKFNPKMKTFNKTKMMIMMMLTFTGAKVIEHPYTTISSLSTMMYFPIMLM